MIKSVLVDYDETLHDTESIFASKMDGIFNISGREVYRKFMYEVHMKVIHQKYPERHDDWNFQGKLLCKLLDEPYDQHKINLLSSRFKEASQAMLDSPILFTDTHNFLESLTNAGYMLSLSSGKKSKEKAAGIKRILGKDYFKFTLGSEVVGHDKLELAYYQGALKIVGSTPEETLSIGDNILIDIYPAKAVGIKTLWVNRQRMNPPEDPKMNPDFEVSDLTQALDVILKM